MTPNRINFVANGWDGSSGTTWASPAINITTGNTIVAMFGADNTTWTITGVTDTAGNTYVKATNSASNYREEIWVAKNATGNAANVVTATYSAAVSFRASCIIQYNNVDLTTPVDVTDYTTGASTGTITSGTLTGTATESIHVLTTRWGFSDTGFPSGFTKFTGAAMAEVADKQVNGGAFSGTYTLSPGHYYSLAVILKGAPGADPPAVGKITQDAIEVLHLPSPKALVTQSGVEVLTLPLAPGRITQSGFEVLTGPLASGRISQTGVEILTPFSGGGGERSNLWID